MSRARRQDGSIAAFVAIAFVALFALAGLAVDGGRALAARQQASAEAEEAARAGAQAISQTGLRDGIVMLDPVVARYDAMRYLQQIGAQGTVLATESSVSVTVDAVVPTTILGIVGIRQFAVHATAAADDQHGISRED